MQMSVFFVRVYVFVKQPIKINLAEDFLNIRFFEECSNLKRIESRLEVCNTANLRSVRHKFFVSMVPI